MIVARREAINEGIEGEKKRRRRWIVEDDGDRKVIRREAVNEGIGRELEKQHAM